MVGCETLIWRCEGECCVDAAAVAGWDYDFFGGGGVDGTVCKAEWESCAGSEFEGGDGVILDTRCVV